MYLLNTKAKQNSDWLVHISLHAKRDSVDVETVFVGSVTYILLIKCQMLSLRPAHWMLKVPKIFFLKKTVLQFWRHHKT